MNNGLNVCLINESFPPIIDGVANTVLNYARVIQNNFGGSVVVTPQNPKAVDDYPFPVIRYPSVRLPKASGYDGYRVGFPAYGVLRKVKKRDIDIIHCHSPFISTLASKPLRASVKAPVIMTYHTRYDVDIAKMFDSEILQTLAAKFIVSNIDTCDEIWVVSNGAGENLRSLGYTGEYRVMKNGVDFPKERAPESEVLKINELHGLSDEYPLFLYVGRMVWYKGIKIILDGLFRAKAEGSRFKMIFVGGGPDYNEIRAYAATLGLSDDCIFTGVVEDRETLRAYFSRAEAFIFPSTYDTNGIVVGEAAACGLASILIRGSSAADDVIDGRNGILIEENPESLAAALLKLQDKRETLREIGKNAMDELYLSWDDSVARAYVRYQELLELRRG